MTILRLLILSYRGVNYHNAVHFAQNLLIQDTPLCVQLQLDTVNLEHVSVTLLVRKCNECNQQLKWLLQILIYYGDKVYKIIMW